MVHTAQVVVVVFGRGGHPGWLQPGVWPPTQPLLLALPPDALYRMLPMLSSAVAGPVAVRGPLYRCLVDACLSASLLPDSQLSQSVTSTHP